MCVGAQDTGRAEWEPAGRGCREENVRPGTGQREAGKTGTGKATDTARGGKKARQRWRKKEQRQRKRGRKREWEQDGEK